MELGLIQRLIAFCISILTQIGMINGQCSGLSIAARFPRLIDFLIRCSVGYLFIRKDDFLLALREMIPNK